MKTEDIKNIAVLGTGTMGPGIIQSYTLGGYNLHVYDLSMAQLEKFKRVLKGNLDTFVKKEVITQEEAEQAYNRVEIFDNLEHAVEGCQYVQETVSEKRDIKKGLFDKLDEILPLDTIIVTNTSSLNPFELICERRKPYFTTAHWFAPPHIIPLVEVARCEKTEESTIETVMGVLKKCGKVPVRLEKFVPGYLINRLQILLNTEIFYLLENGVCTPEMLDLAVKASLMPRGMVLGVVQRYDFTGLDISANNIINGSYKMPETSKRPKALFDHVDKGELGVKTGKGFYDYTGRDIVELNAKRDEMLIDVFKNNKYILNSKI